MNFAGAKAELNIEKLGSENILWIIYAYKEGKDLISDTCLVLLTPLVRRNVISVQSLLSFPL